MRLRPALATLALAGCGASPAEPYTPSGSPPSGLAATLVALPRSPGAPLPPAPSVAAAGDSVAVTAVLIDNCVHYSATAGVTRGVLVVTLVDSTPPEGRICAAIASLGAFRATVRPAPRGRYAVALRTRFVGLAQPPQEIEVVRRTVTLR